MSFLIFSMTKGTHTSYILCMMEFIWSPVLRCFLLSAILLCKFVTQMSFFFAHSQALWRGSVSMAHQVRSASWAVDRLIKMLKLTKTEISSKSNNSSQTIYYQLCNLFYLSAYTFNLYIFIFLLLIFAFLLFICNLLLT